MSTGRNCFLTLAAVIAIAGCSPWSRVGVTALSENQQAYFKKLDATLTAGRPALQDGLNLQLAANTMRRMQLNDWQHDLDRAEILLRVDPAVSGNKRLLSLQLAQLNLQRIETIAAREETNSEQVAAILSLYDRVQKAVTELQKNNQIITEYLGSSNKQFALRSLDINGIVAAVTGIQSARDQLGKIEARTEEERKQDREHLQKAVERAREALLQWVEAGN